MKISNGAKERWFWFLILFNSCSSFPAHMYELILFFLLFLVLAYQHYGEWISKTKIPLIGFGRYLTRTRRRISKERP